MKRTKVIVTMLILSLLISNISMVFADEGGAASKATISPLVPQGLDYTENPVDIPNPDRGYYRANDGMVVPTTGSATSGSITGANGTTSTNVGGAPTVTRMVQAYFDLRNYSSNSFTSRGTRYTASYYAPEGQVTTGQTGTIYPDAPYTSHFDYWQENVLTQWPNGESQPITQNGLDYIKHKLQQVRDGNTVINVRLNYDGMGYGWVDVDHPIDGYVDRSVADIEPDKETLLNHIAQLKPILHEYEDVILAVEGGMFGPWGEMHSTTFGTSTEANAWLLDAWLDAVPESRSIIVHAGAYMSWYNKTYGTDYTFANVDQMPKPERGTPEARFGVFNDSYGYGEDEGDDYPNDWGSLSEGAGWPGDPLGDEASYDRGRVMTWIRSLDNFYGGEAQGGRTLWNTYPFVAWEASYAQTTYLNADYSASVHNRWRDFTYNAANVGILMENSYKDPYKTDYAIFDPVYDGRTGAEYWRDRLGFRLVLRDANAPEKTPFNGALEFEGKIQNVGFGNIVNKKDVKVILKGAGGTYTALTTLDARDWKPDLDSRATNTDAWRDLNFTVNMEDFDAAPPLGDYDIYLKINDPKETHATKRSIQFANNGGIWDASIAANKIGSTTVANIPLDSIRLSKSAISLVKGNTVALDVIYNPINTTDNKAVTWSSDHEGVATVVDGVITALSEGTTGITATVGNKHATCIVTVANIKSTSITLNHNAISLKAGTSQSLGTTIKPANVTSHHKTWKSNNPSVATVDAVGKITAKKVGTAKITVTTTDSGKTDVCDVTVTPAKIAKPAKVTKVQAKVGKTKANISWKKASKALGYQITYSTDKKFKKGKATNTITINKAVTKKLIKQLKSNKTYYFRVRAINKNADGKTQYGKWSNKVKAKIK